MIRHAKRVTDTLGYGLVDFPGLFNRVKDELDLASIPEKRKKLNYEIKLADIRRQGLEIRVGRSKFNETLIAKRIPCGLTSHRDLRGVPSQVPGGD